MRLAREAALTANRALKSIAANCVRSGDAEFTAVERNEAMKSNWLSALLLAAAIPLSASAAEMKDGTANKSSAAVAQASTKSANHAKKGKKAKTPKADSKATPKS